MATAYGFNAKATFGPGDGFDPQRLIGRSISAIAREKDGKVVILLDEPGLELNIGATHSVSFDPSVMGPIVQSRPELFVTNKVSKTEPLRL